MEYLYDGVRSVKHDMKNHMAVPQNLIRKKYSEEDEEIRQYFEGMYQSVEQLDSRVHTGNAVSDAVVGSKFRYAAKKVKGIKLDARGFMLSDAVTIKAYDRETPRLRRIQFLFILSQCCVLVAGLAGFRAAYQGSFPQK